MPQSILVVSDEQVARRLADVADARGLEVVAVATREEAVAAISANPAGVAVVDVQRTGADGWALVDALRALDPSTEVIVIADAIRADAIDQPRDVFAVAFDMMPQYRVRENVLSRPFRGACESHMITGHHEIMLPLLYLLLRD